MGIPAGGRAGADRRDRCAATTPSACSARASAAKTISAPNSRLKLIARFGVGYDTVDVPALTQHGILLTITPDGVRRPVASSVMALILSMAHRLSPKDKLTREGRWKEKGDFLGFGLTGQNAGRDRCGQHRQGGVSAGQAVEHGASGLRSRSCSPPLLPISA